MSYTDTAKRVYNCNITRLVDGNLRVENAVIIFKNFGGQATQFNPTGGKRTFSVCLPKEWADILKEDGTIDKLKMATKIFSDNIFFGKSL